MSRGIAFIVPGFYSSVWMIVLLVQSNQVLAGLTCFQCSAVSNLTTCTSTVRCLDNEECYAERDSSGESDVYNLACEDRTACRVWESAWSDTLVGRKRGANFEDDADDTEERQPWCNRCCDSHNCNQFLCSKGSGWLNKTCTTNNDCPARNSECFVGVCLCTPGYYYSHSQDSCILNCDAADLRKQLLEYPFMVLNGYNDQTVKGISLAACKARCLTLGWCRTVEHDFSINYCFLQTSTPLDHPLAWQANQDYHFYQRMCS